MPPEGARFTAVPAALQNSEKTRVDRSVRSARLFGLRITGTQTSKLMKENNLSAGADTRRGFIKKTATAAAVVATTNIFRTPVYGQSTAPSTGRVIGAND